MTFDVLATLAKLALLAFILLNVAPVMSWVERRGSAYMQDRPGPNRLGPLGLFQAIADGIKFLFKEDVTPAAADKPLYLMAPVLALVPALTTIVVVPFGPTIEVAGRKVDLVVSGADTGVLLFLALASLGVYSLVIAGYASNNKYSLFGSLRASAQMISYELSLTLSVVAVLLPVGSFNLSAVVDYQRHHLWFAIPQALGFFVFMVAAFAETNRIPFDLPEAESELVAGYHTEYSALRFASFMMGEYMNMATLSALATTLFLGGWSLPGVGPRRRLDGRRRRPGGAARQGGLLHGLLRLGALDLPPLPLRPADAPGVEGAAAAGHRQRGVRGGGDAGRLDVTVELAIFLLFAALALGSAVVVVAHRNPVYSTMSLVVTLVSLAALFVLLGAPFIAALQVLIYTGAILVLFLFVIMLLNIGREEIGAGRYPQKVAAGLGALIFGGMVALLFWRTYGGRSPAVR